MRGPFSFPVAGNGLIWRAGKESKMEAGACVLCLSLSPLHCTHDGATCFVRSVARNACRSAYKMCMHVGVTGLTILVWFGAALMEQKGGVNRKRKKKDASNRVIAITCSSCSLFRVQGADHMLCYCGTGKQMHKSFTIFILFVYINKLPLFQS